MQHKRHIMKQFQLKFLCTFFILAIMFLSCEEEKKVDLPTSVIIHYSIVDKQVAFTALAHSTETYLWDFGDGDTSTEKNPVHVYTDGGYYTVTLTVTGSSGTADDAVDLAIALTPYVLLTGGPTAENGKTWRLASSHSEFDYFANADAELSPFPGAPNPLPAGILGVGLDLGEVYLDEFTFYFDGRYEHDVKDDNASFSGLVYQFVTTGGAGIVNPSSDQDFGLCTGLYAPEAGATFTYVENEDFECSSVYGPGGVLTYNDVSTLDFSGTEFIGFMDFQRKVIVQEVTDNSMRLVMFMAAGQDPAIIGINTHALILTFEVVN